MPVLPPVLGPVRAPVSSPLNWWESSSFPLAYVVDGAGTVAARGLYNQDGDEFTKSPYRIRKVDAILVAGSGTAVDDFNGVYFRDGDYDGRPQYQGPNTFLIYWSISISRWIISNGDRSYDAFVSLDDVATPDLATTWNAPPVSVPAPTVTRVNPWQIVDGDDNILYSNPSTSLTPPDTGWVAETGSAPAPVVTPYTITDKKFGLNAGSYLRRLGDLRIERYDKANARMIDRLVANGGNFWPTSGAFVALAGYAFPGTGAGAVIPLQLGHNAGTLFSFVTGDWNVVTGLKGNAVDKYANSNRPGNSDPLNDCAMGVYNSVVGTRGSVGAYIGHGSTNNNAVHFGRSGASPDSYYSRHRTDTTGTPSGNSNTAGLVAITRDNGSDYILYDSGLAVTLEEASVGSLSNNSGVFCRINGTTPMSFSDGRVSFYHIGPNLNGSGELDELDEILTDWQTDLANA